MQEASGYSTTPNAARTISCKAWNSPPEYPSWVARCDIKGSVSTVLNPMFSKKVLGQKHPGRWGIVEHQIPSIKVLFETNTKGHKRPSIRLLSKCKTQLVNQRKQKVAFRFWRLFLDLLSMGWRGCASAMGAIKLPPSCSSPNFMCQSIYVI